MAVKKVKRLVRQKENKDSELVFDTEKKMKLLARHDNNEDIEVFPYKIEGTNLWVWNDIKEKYLYVSNAVKIKRIKRNIETQDIQGGTNILVLRQMDNHNG
ncbi:hypothetical protein PD280_07380 [Virgibacillus salarius]|uniref:hypothetical protein n=1 Tax=Virgibacillus salarius TaxID=447199 RepID=UPI002492E448|nr:hypothetical protein [Virgibacillus salarius]WBX81513.1 hypothetical protein PD280_07380 [Virgibacillus salarius]